MSGDARQEDPELELIAAFLPARQRLAILSLHALYAEIRMGVFSVTDESLARVKLGWWRDEIERMLNHQASHPVTKALADKTDIGRLDTGELGDVLEGVLMQLEARLYNDDDEMLLHCWRNDAALVVSGARLVGAESASALKAARHHGMARGLARLVLRFDVDRRAGRCWIPEPRLKDRQLTPNALFRENPDTATRVALLAPLADLADAYVQSAGLEDVEGEERQRLRPAVLMAMSDMHALARLRKTDYRGHLPGQLSRLFNIWRTARREARASRI